MIKKKGVVIDNGQEKNDDLKNKHKLFNFINNMHSIVLPLKTFNEIIKLVNWPLRILNKNKFVSFAKKNNILCKHDFTGIELKSNLNLFTNTTIDDLCKTLIIITVDDIENIIKVLEEFYTKNNRIKYTFNETSYNVGTHNLYENIQSNEILKIGLHKNYLIPGNHGLKLNYLNDKISCSPKNFYNKIEEIITKNNIKILFIFSNWHLNQISLLSEFLKSKNLFYKLRMYISIHDWPKVTSRFVPKAWVKWEDKKPKLDFNIHFIDKGHHDVSLYFYYLQLYFKNPYAKNLNMKPNFCNNIFLKNQINNDPINKILLLGCNRTQNYTERINFKNYCINNPDKAVHFDKIDYYEYAKKSWNYISAFIGPVTWDFKWKRKGYKIRSAKILTTKFFEFSALGLLQLVHENIRKSVEYLGYKDYVSCIFVNENNYDEKINFILDPKNRNLVDNIRKEGQRLTINNFTETHAKEDFNIMLNKI